MKEFARKAEEKIKNQVPLFTAEPSVKLFLCGDWEWDSFLIAHILYPYTQFSMTCLYQYAQGLSTFEKKEIVRLYCQDKESRGNRRNKPGRALEFGYPITFDLIGDLGIYRDLQRHRMLTQQRQLLTPFLGEPEVNPDIIEAGFEKEVRECIERSRELYDLLLKNCGAEVAQYAVLYIFNVRWYMGMNHREAFHLMELRTIPQGHPSYRRLVQEMHRELLKRDQLVAPLMEFVDYNEYQWNRADSEAAQRRKEQKLTR